MPVVAWMLVISFASTDLMSAAHTSRFIVPFFTWLIPEISEPALATIQLLLRKAAHVTEYAILAGLLARALFYGCGGAALSAFLQPLLIASCYAVLDEFHQSFVASRTASPFDVIIDTCGAIIGLVLYWILAQRHLPEKANGEANQKSEIRNQK